MSEAANVRLVRCPNCENLLPEVTDYSVYQCGGCGAVLRAKNKGVDLDTFSEKSYEEKNGSSIEKLSDIKYEKIMNVSERRIMMDTSDGSESDVRSTVSSSSRADRRRFMRNRGEHKRTNLRSKEENWDLEADIIQDKTSNELQRAKVAQDFDDLEIYDKNENGSRRALDGRNGDTNEMEGFRRYRKEGPSSFVSRSGYEYENPPYGYNNVDYIGDDRDELIRKLDELKFELSRSGNLSDKGKGIFPVDRKMVHQDPYATDNWVSKQNSYHGLRSQRPTYPNQYAEPPPLMRRQEMGGNDFYPPRYAPNHVQEYGDPSRSHMHRRNSNQAHAPYISPSHVYKSGPYMDDDGMMYMDAMEPYPPSFRRHQFPSRIMPTAYGDNYSDVSSERNFNHRDNLSQFGSRDYGRRISDPHPPLKPLNAQLHVRWPSDVNSEVDGFIRRHPQKARLASNGKCCLPIAGGAPFLTCYNCFELLILPKKALSKNNDNRKKISCGACSTVIVFTVSNKKLVFSFDVEPKEIPVKIDKRDQLSVNGDGHLMNQASTAFTSDDYDNSGYNFHYMDKAKLLADIKNRHSTSTYTSEVEEDNKSLSAVRRDSSLADVSKDDKGPRPLAGSSLQDHFEYSNKYNVDVVNRLREGNRSGRSEKDKMFPNKNTNGQTLRKESSATEIDLSSNEYANTGNTFDSAEASREGDRLKASRAANSYFAGVDFNESNGSNEAFEEEKANVIVNGHLISGRLIKKAEKLAGPIHPGNYWYDFRAGFWGAIGGSCLGIIPPFIEEFNYPMPEHCAAGNTRVFVNGRELNQKDLNLLGSRGLPTEGNRSYIVEISGRVLDDDTGEELESLGKLAPTVERMKHGFGMKAPKAVA